MGPAVVKVKQTKLTKLATATRFPLNKACQSKSRQTGYLPTKVSCLTGMQSSDLSLPDLHTHHHMFCYCPLNPFNGVAVSVCCPAVCSGVCLDLPGHVSCFTAGGTCLTDKGGKTCPTTSCGTILRADCKVTVGMNI